jgi:hypothetical protein
MLKRDSVTRWLFFDLFISTFCVCDDGFQGLSKAFHYPVQLLTFLFGSLKLLTIFENA